MKYIYHNGNSRVSIDDKDGSRVITTDYDDFDLEFPVSIDMSIGRRCDGGCAFCYEGATPDGPEADLMNDLPFIDTLQAYTEVAINGNSVNHPQLIPFLKKLKEKNIFVNMTVNQKHFIREQETIRNLIADGLIKAIGVSLVSPTDRFLRLARKFPDLVIHTIAGVHSQKDYEALKGAGLKVLVLGYKVKGLGVDYVVANSDAVLNNITWLRENLGEVMHWYPLMAFDNLALDQLEVRSHLTDDEWARFYQGDEGTLSMYIDLTKRRFGVSSMADDTEMMPLEDDIFKMFRKVKEIKYVYQS